MDGKVCLVTGASRGIGRATVEGLARLGATILMSCRNREAGEAARREIIAATGNSRITLLVADLSSQAEVRRLIAEVKEATPRLDVLINNAGAFYMHREKTVDGVEATFATNHLSSFLLTTGLLDLLEASAPARIIMVASEAHQRVTDPEDWESTKRYNGITAYGRSKLANVMFSYDLAHRLEGSGVTINACHPGVVGTDLLESGYKRWWAHWAWPLAKRFTITPEDAATSLLYLAASRDVEGVSGKYFKRSRPATSSLLSHDAVVGARLWNVSLRLTGQLPAIEITGEHISH